MRAALGFLADLDSLVSCIDYILTHFHYFPHNYRSDIMLVPLRNENIWKYFVKEIKLCTVKPREMELRFFEIPPSLNKISNTLESWNLVPIYELFDILCLCA